MTKKLPAKKNIYFVNAKKTPCEYPIPVLQKHFQMTQQQAEECLQRACDEGMAFLGTYTQDIAETKAELAEKDRRETPITDHQYADTYFLATPRHSPISPN